MSQRAWLVPAEVVRSLTADFVKTGRRVCLDYRPVELQAALDKCSVVDGGMLFGSVAFALSKFECRGLTAGCNRWTLWMRQRLRDTKFLPEEL